MVLDSGVVVEYGSPWNLLQKQDGIFSKMVSELGSETDDQLREIAKNYHDITNQSEKKD